MHVEEIGLSVVKLEDLIAGRYISRRWHDDAPLQIMNYTPSAVYDKVWCEETLTCRGLILDSEYNVIARPFRKFFNLEEHSRSDIVFSKSFDIFDKEDGSLGILYPAPDGPAIATRGSFASEQALRATDILRRKYEPWWEATKWAWGNTYWNLTYLFEIIYPTNRIVIDYKGLEDLVLLAVIDNETGRDDEKLDLNSHWPGSIVKSYDVNCKPRDVIAAIGAKDDGQTEGYVLRFNWPKEGPQTRIKVKLEEYKRLHAVLTQTSNKTVWKALANGDGLDKLLDSVPDEFYTFVKYTAASLLGLYREIEMAATCEFEKIKDVLGPNFKRKDFAESVKNQRHKALLFLLLDGNKEKFQEVIWKQIEPDYERPFSDGEA